MKESKPVFLYGLTVLLLVYAVFSTIQMRKMESRIGTMESQLAHIFDPKFQWVEATH